MGSNLAQGISYPQTAHNPVHVAYSWPGSLLFQFSFVTILTSYSITNLTNWYASVK